MGGESAPSSDEAHSSNFICGVVEGSFNPSFEPTTLLIDSTHALNSPNLLANPTSFFRILRSTMDDRSKERIVQNIERFRVEYVHVRT